MSASASVSRDLHIERNYSILIEQYRTISNILKFLGEAKTVPGAVPGHSKPRTRLRLNARLLLLGLDEQVLDASVRPGWSGFTQAQQRKPTLEHEFAPVDTGAVLEDSPPSYDKTSTSKMLPLHHLHPFPPVQSASDHNWQVAHEIVGFGLPVWFPSRFKIHEDVQISGASKRHRAIQASLPLMPTQQTKVRHCMPGSSGFSVAMFDSRSLSWLHLPLVPSVFKNLSCFWCQQRYLCALL